MNESIKNHEQDTYFHGGANEGCKHSTTKAWRNTWPTSQGYFWQDKKKVIANDTPKKRREFDDIYISLSKAFEILSKKGYLKPLEPTLLPIPIPNTWTMNEYCTFHEKLGRKKDNCIRMKHEIQDLIDGGVIVKPRC